MRIARLAGVPFALTAALLVRDVRAGNDAKSDPGTFVTRIDAPAGKAFKYHWTEKATVEAAPGYGDNYESGYECDLVFTAAPSAADRRGFEVAFGPTKARTAGSPGKSELDTARASPATLGHSPADKTLLRKDVVVLASQKIGVTLTDRLGLIDVRELDKAWTVHLAKLGTAQRKWLDGMGAPWKDDPCAALDLRALFAVADTVPGIAGRTTSLGDGGADTLESLDDDTAVIASTRKLFLGVCETTDLARMRLSRRDGMPMVSTHVKVTLALDATKHWTSKTTVGTTLTRTGVVDPKPAAPVPGKPDGGK